MSENFNMSSSIPSWVNQEFFEKVIRYKESNSHAEVIGFKVNPATKPGENFASIIFRVTITYKVHSESDEETISVILKIQPEPEQKDEEMFLGKILTKMFHNEAEAYENVLPLINELWRSNGIDDHLNPKIIYKSTEPCSLIILEDLRPLNYSIKKNIPQDFEISKLIVRRLAKFHAASFYLANESQLNFSRFNTNVFQDPMVVKVVYKEGLESFIKVVRELEGFQKFIPNLENFMENFMSKVQKTYTPSESGFNVLNHNDFHLNNVLFKNEDDKDFYIIDYQLANYSTPAIDLIFALHSFVSPENRRKHRDEFVFTYYQQFANSLQKFGFTKSVPSLVDLQTEMLRHGHFEVLLAICTSILLYVDFESAPEDENFFQNADFLEMISMEMPRFLHNGFI